MPDSNAVGVARDDMLELLNDQQQHLLARGASGVGAFVLGPTDGTLIYIDPDDDAFMVTVTEWEEDSP